jgi:hypothetical protein
MREYSENNLSLNHRRTIEPFSNGEVYKDPLASQWSGLGPSSVKCQDPKTKTDDETSSVLTSASSKLTLLTHQSRESRRGLTKPRGPGSDVEIVNRLIDEIRNDRHVAVSLAKREAEDRAATAKRDADERMVLARRRERY